VAFQVRFVRSWAEGSDARGEWGLEENDVVDNIMTNSSRASETHSSLMTHCYPNDVVDNIMTHSNLMTHCYLN